jgi:4-hydroxybenzoate polyprenyltransferase
MSGAAGPTLGARLWAYVELARLSNAPTVASNAVAGAGLAAIAQSSGEPLRNWTGIALTAAACSAFYVAGMALNDLIDRRIDADERPFRPIPSGRVSPSGAAAFASVGVIGGLWLLSGRGSPALTAGVILVALIVAYDLLHHRTRLAVFLMGGCRAMVYVTGALAAGLPSTWFPILLPATVLLAYVAGFSLIARHEAEAADSVGPGRSDFAALVRLLPFLPLASVLVLADPSRHRLPRSVGEFALLGAGAIVAAALVSWIAAAGKAVAERPPRIGRAVTMWIAGISLIDAFLLVLAGSLPWAAAAVGAFFLTRLLQRRIAGT